MKSRSVIFRFGADVEVVLAEADLNPLPRSRLFPNPGADCPLGVEQGAVSAAGKHPVVEALSALPERGQLEGGTPGHLFGVEDGDWLIVLVHVGRPPVADMLEQAGEAGVGG
jgi:hypothetical protein